jgi:hypothetical protein
MTDKTTPKSNRPPASFRARFDRIAQSLNNLAADAAKAGDARVLQAAMELAELVRSKGGDCTGGRATPASE